MNNYFEKYSVPLILDGAVGSLLQSRIGENDSELWSSIFNLTHPEKVKSLHLEYLEAGADIITANTFRTNPIALSKMFKKDEFKSIVQKSVKLALELKKDSNFILAGSNAPAEDCYQRKRTLSIDKIKDNHKYHIEYLLSSEVDFILNETFSHMDEIRFVCEYCSANEINFVISLYVNEDCKILSGENLSEVLELVHSYTPDLVMLNCIKLNTLNNLRYLLDRIDGFYANCGLTEITSKKLSKAITPENYVKSITKYISENTKAIGACCGSTPLHIKKLKEAINELH